MKSLCIKFLILITFTCILLSSCTSTKQNQAEVTTTDSEKVNWMDAPSLKEAYSGIFPYIGVAVADRELKDGDSIDGISYHFNSITMENEFKPQFMFNWQQPNALGTFTSSKGVTIQVPTNVPSFERMDFILMVAKALDIKMRGHVLVWHNQTEQSFFREDYKASNKLVSKEIMDARQEWYIKTVLEHIANWEEKNNKGNRIVYCWDVVNEAVSDGANSSNYLRNSGSDWYSIYKSDEFIVNAFRYANKYAPKDVQLAYNDYGCTNPGKTAGILKIIDSVKATEKDDFLPGRIDVIGMQSHVDMMNPSTTSFDIAIRKFLDKGVDVQITELDVGGTNASNEKFARFRYNELFKTFAKYQKVGNNPGITGVTIWGINDERSWIATSNNGTAQAPLLFTRDFDNGYMTKPCFFGALEAANQEN